MYSDDWEQVNVGLFALLLLVSQMPLPWSNLTKFLKKLFQLGLFISSPDLMHLSSGVSIQETWQKKDLLTRFMLSSFGVCFFFSFF